MKKIKEIAKARKRYLNRNKINFINFKINKETREISCTILIPRRSLYKSTYQYWIGKA